MFFGAMFSHTPYTPPTASSTEPVACTMEAKLCPDGSYVGRTGPNCEFTACPTTATTTPHKTVSVSSLTPSSGVVGSTVTIKGSGFTSDNTIKFGIGTIIHVAAKSSTSLTFTVPNSLTPACFYSEPRCMIATRLTTPGVYAVSVQNSGGTSNALNYTVTDGTTPPEPTSISIQSISPKSGPVGTEVTLTGRFMSDNNIVHFGAGAIANVPITSSIAVACTTNPSCVPGIRQTLVFTVPQSVGPYCKSGMACPMYMQLITPGTYKVSVENENGISNTVEFTVAGGTSSSGGTLSVSGLDAPASLSLGTAGTWTVHVTTNTAAGNLHYSVVWGDEVSASSASIRDPGTVDIQTSATFTHSYQHSGVFQPTFTITDDMGHSVTTGSTVVVTPLY
jgi:hypothetical protein